MRKELISTVKQETQPPRAKWLSLDAIAIVQVTSEQEGYPIESALFDDNEKGWRASSEGTQTIRFVFDDPQKLSRIWLVFEDTENTRTQEFVLRWSPDNGRTLREIVRQQWNFSPPDSVRETEDYAVALTGVTMLELVVIPDRSGGKARASLAKLRVA
jgi:hypothetical protein